MDRQRIHMEPSARLLRMSSMIRKWCWTALLILTVGTLVSLHHIGNHNTFVTHPPNFHVVNISNTVLYLKTLHYDNHPGKHGFPYVIGENDMCKGEDIFLFIAVCVSPSSFKQRTAIRNTWGSIVHTNKKVKLLFFIGISNDTDLKNAIVNESLHHHDIVQHHFIDSYRNLTLKSISVLKWTSTYCFQTRYVLKVDDDMFINVPFLIDFLNTSSIHNSIIGQRISASKPIRNKTSKWYTSERLYIDKYYPAYTSGTSYVISGDILAKLYKSTFLEPFFWLEDVYITGLCRRRAGADIVDNWDFTCLYRTPRGCSYKYAISGHRNTPEEIVKIWRELQDPHLNCSSS